MRGSNTFIRSTERSFRPGRSHLGRLIPLFLPRLLKLRQLRLRVAFVQIETFSRHIAIPTSRLVLNSVKFAEFVRRAQDEYAVPAHADYQPEVSAT